MATPVDFDPFAQVAPLGVPVDHDPFADKYQQAAADKFATLKKAGVNPSYGPTEQFTNGALLGALPTIMASLETPFAMASHGTLNPREGYNYAKAEQNLANSGGEAAHPYLSAGANLAGGVMTGSSLPRAGLTAVREGAGLLGKIAGSAADGAALGGASGFLSNEGSDRLSGAAQGAALGGAIGGGVPAALGVLKGAAAPVTSNIAARLWPENSAKSTLARALISSGQTPEGLQAALDNATAAGQPQFTLADALGKPGADSLSNVVRSPGEAGTQAANFLDARQAAQGRDVGNQLSQGLGVNRTAAQLSDALLARRSADAATNYGAARAAPGAAGVDISPAIDAANLSLYPSGFNPNQFSSPALYHGSKVSGLTDLNPSNRGPMGPGVYLSNNRNTAQGYVGPNGQVYEVPAGKFNLFPGVHNTGDGYDAFNQGKSSLLNAIEPEMRERIAPIIDAMQPGDGYRAFTQISQQYRDQGKTQDLFKRAGYHGIDAYVDGPESLVFGNVSLQDTKPFGPGSYSSPNSNIADNSIESAVRRAKSFLTDGKSQLSNFPDVLSAKQEIDNLIEGGTPSQQRALIPIKQALDNAMINASPAYRHARDAFAQTSREVEAIPTGKAAARTGRPEDTIPAYNRLSSGEQSAYRTGYADPLLENATNGNPNANKALPLQNEGTRAELGAMSQYQGPLQPGAQDQLAQALNRSDAMNATFRRARTGSQTFDNLSEGHQAGVDPGILWEMARGNFHGAAADIFHKSVNALSGSTPETRNYLAQMLLMRGPTADVASALSPKMQQIEAANKIKQALMGATLGGSAVISSRRNTLGQ